MKTYSTLGFVFLAVIAAAEPVRAQQTIACPVFGPKAVVGAAVGAAIGAGIGSAITKGRGQGGLIGGLAGGAFGGSVGAQLDQQDCIQAQAALQQMKSVPTGQQISWSNPNTGDHGALTPESDPAPSVDGRACPKYKTDAAPKGATTQTHEGVVCENPNGDWEAVS